MAVFRKSNPGLGLVSKPKSEPARFKFILNEDIVYIGILWKKEKLAILRH